MEKYCFRKRNLVEDEGNKSAAGEEETFKEKRSKLSTENCYNVEEEESTVGVTLSSKGTASAEEQVRIKDSSSTGHVTSGDLSTQPVVCNSDVSIEHVKMAQGLNVVYYPRFIQNPNKYFKNLETQLSQYYSTSPNTVMVFGKSHSIPRRQTAFGDPGISYSFSGVTVPANPWIPITQRLKEAVEATTNEFYNFVLVNYYRNGLDHIGEHRDDERELCPSSSIASLSLGQERDFVFCHKDARGKKTSTASSGKKDIPRLKLCLANGSLLVMRQPTNHHWYHSLPVRKTVKGARINLTFRRMKV